MLNRSAALALSSTAAVLLATTAVARADSVLPDFGTGLGPYPILQFFGGLLIFATTALMYVRGQKRSMTAPVEQTEVYFDGPLAQALKVLERIATGIEEMKPARQDISDLKERYEAALADTRRTVYARMDTFGERIGVCERDCAVLKDRPRPRGGG